MYRQNLRKNVADLFRIHVVASPDIRSPVHEVGNTTFFHITHENLYLVAVSKANVSVAVIFEFLYKLANLGKSYFGRFTEESVKNNFALIYELLDEVLDFGYPQNTETNTLKMYITTEGITTEKAIKEDSSKITIQATGAISWRQPGIKYRKNEAFVDVIENLNVLMSSNGDVLRSDINGQIMVRTFLSGMPECKFGLNDRLMMEVLEEKGARKSASKATTGTVQLEDCQFHQCVRLGKFESDRTISFIPPDGEFELMRYRAIENIDIPFRIHSIVTEIGKSKVDYQIAVKSLFPSKLFASNVVIRIPTPSNAINVNLRSSHGRCKYEPSENSVIWKVSRFTGGHEYVLSGDVNLTLMTEQKSWTRPPIHVSFSILMFTSSGLVVRYLRVFEKNNYNSVKWVRYITKAGNYEVRI